MSHTFGAEKWISESEVREDQVSKLISSDEAEMIKEWASNYEVSFDSLSRSRDGIPWWDEEGNLNFVYSIEVRDKAVEFIQRSFRRKKKQSTKVKCIKKWHAGTGGSKAGCLNYNKCLKTKLYPVGWKRWNKDNPDEENSRRGCKSNLLKFIKSLGDLSEENRIYLHNTMEGRGKDNSVTHYGKPTGKIYCNIKESVDELLSELPESFSDNVIYAPGICGYNQPPGWSEEHLNKRNPRYGLPFKWGTFCLIEVEEWVKLKNPVHGAGLRGTIYTSSKTNEYPDN